MLRYVIDTARAIAAPEAIATKYYRLIRPVSPACYNVSNLQTHSIHTMYGSHTV